MIVHVLAHVMRAGLTRALCTFQNEKQRRKIGKVHATKDNFLLKKVLFKMYLIVLMIYTAVAAFINWRVHSIF